MKPASPRRTRRAPSLAEAAVKRLRRMIVIGEFAPGARLSEPQLGEQLGISRTPVREALKLLAAEGLVELRPNRNAIVARIDPHELAGLFEVETGIEGFAAGLAARRMSEAELRKLRRLQTRMEALHARGQREAYIRVNRQVHALIVGGARNAVLASTHAWLLGRLERARNLALATEGRIEESIREHREILDALERRDAERAARLMADHVKRTGDIFAGLSRNGAISPDHRPLPTARRQSAAASRASLPSGEASSSRMVK